LNKKIQLFYSVDADDAFMFYAIRHHKIDLRGYAFEHNRADTETLNQTAFAGNADVIAISAFAYARASEHYLMLPHGGSVGQNYGPVIVSKTPYRIEDLAGLKLAIPGENTTAANVVRMLNPNQQMTVVPIDPFYEIFGQIEKGSVDAGLVIHEGRMCYDKLGFYKIIDIGEWWFRQTGLPLVLGVNVIAKHLPAADRQAINEILMESLRWAEAHRDHIIPYLQTLKSPLEKELGLADASTIRDYLGLYANADTMQYGIKEKEGLQYLFDLAREHGLIPEHVTVTYAE
jgi:1,4-dihydroxy-6-naphthoate synthase